MTAKIGVKQLLAAATELLIEAQDRLDGDPDLECADPAEDSDPAEDDDVAEDDDPDSEHDGIEFEDGY
jgi:hypothetical protein